MALKEYIGLARLTEVFGYLKTKLDSKVDKNGTDRLITSSEATKLDNINKVTVIDSSTDLDDCTDINLLYSISGSAVPVHAPTNYSYNAAIWNKTYGDYAVQFYWTNDGAKLYYRRNNNGRWGGWRTIAVTSDIPGVVSKTADGLVPQLPNETTTTKYLRQDGTWAVPPDNNTYDRNRYQAAVKAGSTALDASNIIVGFNGSYHQLNDGTAFDISYPILFLASACDANATTYNSYDIIHVTITTTQAITLTPYIPVFIKGTLSGTTFTPVSTAPLTQTVPTTDDGYQYIFLGNATGTASLYLTEAHDIYEYRNGSFGPMAGSGGSTYTEGDGIDISQQNEISVDTTFTESSSRTNIASGDAFSTILGKIKKFFTDLKTVAFSGSYNDLSDRPTIPAAQVNSDWNASSGVAQILNKPTIPTKTSQLTNDSNYVTTSGSITGSSGSCTGNAATATTASNLANFENVNSSGKNANNVTYNAHTYYTSNGPATSLGASTNDGALYSQAYSTSWVAQIAQDYRNGRLFVRGKNNNTWQSWLRVALFSEIPTNTNQLTNGAGFITSSGSCKYATSAGNADTVDSKHLDWGNGGNVGTSVTYLAAWKNDGTLIGWVERSKISVNYAASAGAVAWGNVSSKPTFSTGATANAVAQRDGSGHLTMVDCKCAAVVVTSNNWLPICGYGAVTIRNRDNSAYIPAFASAFTVNSSRRYKENIVSMTEEDAKALLSLRPVIFDYKEGVIDGDRTGQKGLIAEEVAEIETFPVVYNQEGEVEGLDYSKFVPQLIKLCQMQQKQIDDLTARLDILERAIVTMTQS